MKPTKQYKLEIKQDPYPENPREWGDNNASTMWYAHKRYILGDKAIDVSKHNSWDDALTGIDHAVALPLYLYDHSGLTISTTPFACRWDSGQVGWVVMTKQQILNVLGGRYLTKKKRERALAIMQAEVETYDAYLTGEVYGWVITNDGDEVESCWGYYNRQYAELDGAEALAGMS